MDEVVPDRSLKRLRLDPKSLAEIVEILRRNDRRAVVKLDDVKIDDPTHADAAQLASAKSVDVVSYWVNPDRPTWGRRHFVYLASGPGGAQYFGDSISPEVTTVLTDLDAYFGRLQDAAVPAGATAKLAPTAPTIDDPRVIVAAVVIAVVIALVAFFVGRMSAEAAMNDMPASIPPPATTMTDPQQVQ